MNNFQLVYLPNYEIKNLSESECNHYDIDKFTNDIILIKNNNPSATILFFDIFENKLIDNRYAHHIEQFKIILNTYDLKYFFVFDSLYEHENLITRNNIVLCNWSFLCLYYNIKMCRHEIAESYNPTTELGLLLTGKARHHRIILLKKAFEAKTFNRLLHSFLIPDWQINSLKEQYFPEYDDNKFNDFLNKSQRSLDYTQSFNNGNEFVHIGFPYDVNLYKQTAFSIIAETSYKAHYLFTEKTFKAIVNSHPFISLSNTDNLKKLEELGFNTYRNYMRIKDYCEIDDLDKRINSIITNICTLNINLKTNKNLKYELAEIAKDNKVLLDNLIDNTINNFLQAVNGNTKLIYDIYHFHNGARILQFT